MKERQKFNEGKNKIVKMNAVAQAQLIKLLLEGVYTCKDLAELSGLHYVTVLQYTRELYEAGAAHICMWQKDNRGRDMIKIYKLGEGVDKRRQRMSAAERQAKYRKKVKNIVMQTKLQQVLAGNAEFIDHNNGQVGYKEQT